MQRPSPKTRKGQRLALMVIGIAACGHNPARLPELDRRFYENLETPAAQQRFLRMKPEARHMFLREQGLWQQWAALSAEERAAARNGQIDVGFHEFAVFMAWGPPADTQVKSTSTRTVEFHTFIRCTSGPKNGDFVRSNLECDGTSSETRVAIEAGVVGAIEYGA